MNPEPKEAIYFARFESDGGQTGTVIYYTDSHSSIFVNVLRQIIKDLETELSNI